MNGLWRPIADCPETKDSQHLNERIMGRKKLFAYILVMSLLACSDEHSTNTEAEFRLSDGESSQSFVMPAMFMAGQPTKSLLRFAVQYPSMGARDWKRAPQNDEITVWISFGREAGRTESLVKRAADKIDPTLPGQFYHDGKQGPFEIYRGMLDKTSLLPQVVIYVFRDDEGQLVGVEDPGNWSRAYNVQRQMVQKFKLNTMLPSLLDVILSKSIK